MTAINTLGSNPLQIVVKKQGLPPITFLNRLAGALLCLSAMNAAKAADTPPGCMEMHGEVRCIERQGAPTPKWQQDLHQLNAMNANCSQWLDIYKKAPTDLNRQHMKMACDRSSQKRREIRPEDVVREEFGLQ